MKFAFLALLALTMAAAALFSGSAAPTQAQTPPDPDAIPGRYIVVLRDNAIQDRIGERLDDVIENLRGRFAVQRERDYRTAFRGFVASNVSDAKLVQLRADPRVLFVEADRIARKTDQVTPTGVRRAGVLQNSTASITGAGPNINVDVAVIDTGVDASHPDLNVAGGWGSFCNAACNVCTSVTNTYQDGDGHGTHVSGTIGAIDNNDGVVGVAPGARIWGFKVLNDAGSGCFSDIISAVDQVTACKNIANSVFTMTQCGANAGGINFAAANMSLGGTGTSSALCTAIQNAVNAGVTFAVAAGNSNANASTFTPANCNAPITVSSVNDYNGLSGGGASATCGSYGADDRLASYSNYGAVVDIAAPGSCILSTYPASLATQNTPTCGTSRCAYMSGTSMATPHVTGAAALYKAANPGWTAAQVRSAILGAAFPQASTCGFTGDKDVYAEPLLNLGAACSGSTPNTAPTVSSTSPANNATNVNIANNITATFSEAMTAGTINTTTFQLKDAGNNAVAGAVSLSGNTATFNPTANLANGTVYTATITTGAQDSLGLGLATNYVWTFTTVAAAVNDPPQVSSTSPANNATGVAIANNVTATFNEAMTAGTINTTTFQLKDSGNNAIAGAVSLSGNTATFNPTSDLAYSTVYTATITTGAQDSQGLGLATNYVWSFTTASAPVNNPPQVSSTTPASNATGVAVGANVTATFNEDMNASTLTAGGTFTLKQGSTSIPASVTYNSSTRVLTLDPTSNLAANTVYTAAITTAAQDLSGLAMTSQVTWSFTTAAAVVSCAAPTIASSSDTSASGAGTVTFSWNAVPGATSYEIQRAFFFNLFWSTVTTTSSTSYSGGDATDDPSWRVRVSAGTCSGVPGPFTTFDP